MHWGDRGGGESVRVLRGEAGIERKGGEEHGESERDEKGAGALATTRGG